MYKYLFGIIIVLGVSVVLLFNKVNKESNRADRMTTNYVEMNNANKMLNLKYNELDDRHKRETDSLANLLDVKPKEILKYVNIYVRDTIRDTVYVGLTEVNDTTFMFNEKMGCIEVGGRLVIDNNKPELTFDNVSYNNDIKYVVYLDRKEWQVWFIKSKLFGKKEAELKVFPKCGDVTVEEVELIKR